MQLSVIILNYKVPYHLLLCLESVTKSIRNLEAEIIVVDNHSKDESCQLVKQHFPEVILIENQENSGFSKGNNKGIARAQGEYICLLNPDTVVAENTFSHLLEFAETHPDFGAIGPRLIDGRGNFLPESKRNIPTPKVALNKLLNKTESYYASLSKYETGPVDILAGAFMLMRRDRYHAVGGLDEDYFMYGEDIDLSYKFIKAQYTNYYVGKEAVLHYKGESTARDKIYRKRFFDAMKIFYQKHFQKNLVSKTFVSIGLSLAKTAHPFRQTKNSVPVIGKKHLWIGRKTPFIKKLEHQLQAPIKVLPSTAALPTQIAETTLIFDADTWSYQEILQQFQKLNKTFCFFCIKPKSFDFILGSNTPTEKGKVLIP